MSERMDDWNPPESWKKITCIMMIRAGHQNKDIMTAAQCLLNIAKTIRHELETCNGDYETVARRKIHSRRSDLVSRAEFLEDLQENALRNPGIGIRALSREMKVLRLP